MTAYCSRQLNNYQYWVDIFLDKEHGLHNLDTTFVCYLISRAPPKLVGKATGGKVHHVWMVSYKSQASLKKSLTINRSFRTF